MLCDTHFLCEEAQEEQVFSKNVGEKRLLHGQGAVLGQAFPSHTRNGSPTLQHLKLSREKCFLFVDVSEILLHLTFLILILCTDNIFVLLRYRGCVLLIKNVLSISPRKVF